MPPKRGKLVDYAKIDRDRAAIVKDLEERQKVPQSQRTFPNPIERGRRAVVSVARTVAKVVRESDAKARAKRLEKAMGSPPSQAGARVTGKRRNTSPV